MITNFGSLYAGHVDLGDIGLEATAVNERWFSDEHQNTIYDRATAVAQLMDRAGYDNFWMAEHHYHREGNECIGNLLLLYLHLSRLTENLKFGCGFNITPMWHPLRLAEDFATVDLLTKGRVFSVCAGAITPGRSTPTALPAPTPTATPTGICSKSRWRSS